MANNLKVPLPQAVGAGIPAVKRWWGGDLFGSNNYQQGGYTLYASDFGLSGFETFGISFGGRNSNIANAYYAQVTPPANFANANESLASSFNNCTIRWFFNNNSAEVANNTDLSAVAVRIDIRGV